MEAGKVYHVYNRGNNKQNLFEKDQQFFFFLEKLEKYVCPTMEVFCYCLMPNHFHLLVRVKMNKGLSDEQISKAAIKSFKDLFISFSRTMNLSHGRTGALFQPKFKKKKVEDDAYFTWLIQYIHLNPIKAGLCGRFEDWRYSSYNAIISNRPTKVARDEVREWFGGVESFKAIHEQRIIDEERLKDFIFD
ncbi:MAG TPA: transposase [Chitinophagaceae bacterium]|nr:transposase [Chitinophagaceae bacterium]